MPAQPSLSLFLASFKVTSKAGVAQGDWQQNIEGAKLAQIAGSFNGSMTQYPGTQYSWSGNIAFVPAGQLPGIEGGYKVESGSYTITVSGPYSNGCTVSGSQHATLKPGGGQLDVTATGPDGTSPYGYRLNVPSPPPSRISTRPTPTAPTPIRTASTSPFSPPSRSTARARSRRRRTGGPTTAPTADNSGAPNFAISWHWSLQGTE